MSYNAEQGFRLRADIFEMGSGNGDLAGYRGFRMGFANGYAISVQFGTTNYCAANGSRVPGRVGANGNAGDWLEANCPDAEIAIIAPDGQFVPFKDGHEVRGDTSPDTLAEIIAWVVKQ